MFLIKNNNMLSFHAEFLIDFPFVGHKKWHKLAGAWLILIDHPAVPEPAMESLSNILGSVITGAATMEGGLVH